MPIKNKYVIILFSAFLLLRLQTTAQPKVEYVPPVNLTGDALAEVIAHIEKGKILFKKKCSRCHGVFTDGKEGIPNFSKMELANYNIKFIQEDPLNHAFTQKMTDEEFTDVIFFLQLYKRPEVAKQDAK